MKNETRNLLESADKALDVAYKNVRIAISDLRDKPIDDNLRNIIINIDKIKQELEELLKTKPVSDVEIFELIEDGKRTVFSEANHI